MKICKNVGATRQILLEFSRRESSFWNFRSQQSKVGINNILKGNSATHIGAGYDRSVHFEEINGSSTLLFIMWRVNEFFHFNLKLSTFKLYVLIMGSYPREQLLLENLDRLLRLIHFPSKLLLVIKDCFFVCFQ